MITMQQLEELESRDLGGSWVAKQAFERLSIDDILSSLGMEQKDISQQYKDHTQNKNHV